MILMQYRCQNIFDNLIIYVEFYGFDFTLTSIFLVLFWLDDLHIEFKHSFYELDLFLWIIFEKNWKWHNDLVIVSL